MMTLKSLQNGALGIVSVVINTARAQSLKPVSGKDAC